jgi:hypothetical protein
MTSPVRVTPLVALLLGMSVAHVAHAQNVYNWNTPSGDWALGSNWDLGILPDTSFDDVGNVSNGGTALVNTPIAPSPGQIILGQTIGQTGTLTIGNGGDLAAVFTEGNTSSGGVDVGQAGTGVLTVMPGGRLAGRTLNLGGEAGSRLTLGAPTGGATTVNVEFGTNLARTTRIIGPNVNFATQAVTFQNTSVFVPQITAATHSPIKSTNSAAVAGVLRPEFTNGVTPVAGNKWNLIDAPAVTGQFTLDASAAPALPFGQSYQFAAVPDGTSVNGVYGQLSVKQFLVLNVNRTTGAVSINNGPSPVSIDGYSIRSALGGLKPSGWTSLQDQAVSDWRESPPGGSVNALNELKPTGSTTITAAAPRALGNAFQLPVPAQFGTELEDVTFEYYSAGGVVTQGVVNYLGDKKYNNLVLVVDPATGNARMENQSVLTVGIDGYKITSASGSLRTANGQWNSLDDQNIAGGDWRESNPTANQLIELKPTTSATMTGGVGFNLGSAFKTVATGGTQDLAFQYLFPGDTEFRNGVVVYRTLSTFLPADFNHDNQVNAADLAVWKTSFGNGAGADADGDGDSDGGDFLVWQRQLGMSSGAAAAATVPEPSVLVLLGSACCALVARRRDRRAKVR